MIFKLLNSIVALILLTAFFTFNSIAFTPKQNDETLQTLNADIMKNHIMLIDFNQPSELNHWRIINDGVMGGKSQGSMASIGGYGEFSGYISKENNGGFSSVLRPIKPLKRGLKHLLIDMEGDGLTYQLRAIVYINGYRLAYKQDFTTMNQKREQLRLPLAKFNASFRGRAITGAPPLRSENIVEMGVLVTSKTERKFKLNIHSVSAIPE